LQYRKQNGNSRRVVKHRPIGIFIQQDIFAEWQLRPISRVAFSSAIRFAQQNRSILRGSA